MKQYISASGKEESQLVNSMERCNVVPAPDGLPARDVLLCIAAGKSLLDYFSAFFPLTIYILVSYFTFVPPFKCGCVTAAK